MNRTAILMPCFRSAELLRVSIPSLLKAKSDGDEIIVVLNESDTDSVSVLKEHGVLFMELERNFGPSAVDFAIPAITEGGFDYVANVNSDMLFSKGWTKELITLLEENYPCSTSACLVEPSRNAISVFEDLGHFADLANDDTFQKGVDSGKYATSALMTSYNHPILCRASDFLAVQGYSDGMDEDWVRLFGKGLDDHFAYRLHKLHKGFKFLRSNTAFVYHGIGINSAKTGQGMHNAPQVFERKTGMSMTDFHALVGA